MEASSVMVGKIISIFDISVEVILDSKEVKIGDILQVREGYEEKVEELRMKLFEAISQYDDEFFEKYMEDPAGEFIRYEDEYDMELIKEAVEQGKPVLGICRGMQVVNVLYGGTLYQDIPTQYSEQIVHTRIHPMEENLHTVQIEENSYLAKVLGKTEEVIVNSSHHQAVKGVADGFRVTAKAPDGVIEAMENEDASVVCVQWHPERMQDVEMYQNLIKDFVKRCRL